MDSDNADYFDELERKYGLEKGICQQLHPQSLVLARELEIQ